MLIYGLLSIVFLISVYGVIRDAEDYRVPQLRRELEGLKKYLENKENLTELIEEARSIGLDISLGYDGKVRHRFVSPAYGHPTTRELNGDELRGLIHKRECERKGRRKKK